MVKTLYLIRHGETIDSNERRYKGHIDVPLSEEGIRQMIGLSRYITMDCPNGLDAIYCSDLTRAVKSAEVIAEPFGIKPIILPDLRERNFGKWEGMTFDEIQEKWPHAFKSWAEDPLRHAPPDGEGTLELRDRVIGALEKILNRTSFRFQISNLKSQISDIAIVSHGGVNRIIVCHLLGIPLENLFRIEQDYGCLNVIEFYDDYPVVRLLNYRV
ncbi:MAG: histidine phosphatase family protein [Thermodesulfovibrionia bacterium]